MVEKLDLQPMARMTAELMACGRQGWQGVMINFAKVAKMDGQDPAELIARTGARDLELARVDIEYAQRTANRS